MTTAPTIINATVPSGSTPVVTLGIGQQTMANSHPVVHGTDEPWGYNIGVSNTPTLNAGSYGTVGFVAGGQQTFAVFRNTSQPSGVLNQLAVYSQAGMTTLLTCYIFGAPPASSTVADHGALSLAQADLPKLICPPFQLTPAALASSGATQSYAARNMSVSCKNQEGSATVNLYLVVTVGAIITFGSTTDLTFVMSMAQD